MICVENKKYAKKLNELDRVCMEDHMHLVNFLLWGQHMLFHILHFDGQKIAAYLFWITEAISDDIYGVLDSMKIVWVVVNRV